MTVLVVVAVEAEATALLATVEGARERVPLGPLRGERAGGLLVVAAGVGPGAAGAATAGVCARVPVSAVVSAGLAGGLPGRAAVGDVALATAAVSADLGADSPDGFLPIATLGLGEGRADVDEGLSARLAGRLAAAGVRVRRGEVLTVSTVTGTADRAAQLAARHPQAVAEAMEGAAVLAVAAAEGLPGLEVRAISNLVGPRDRDAWDLPAAFAALAACGGALAALAEQGGKAAQP